MNAYADGLNYYLYKHPDVKPKVIAHFEPWMPLAFSDGSIGPDIESVNLTQLAAFGSSVERDAGRQHRRPHRGLDRRPRVRLALTAAQEEDVRIRGEELACPIEVQR